MKIYNKLSHLLISLTLIFNQLGVDLNLHYCGGSFSSLSFINQSTDCGMHSKTDINSSKVLSYNSESCCEDKTLNTYLIDFQFEPIFEIENHKLSTSTFVNYTFNNLEPFLTKNLPAKDSPPVNKNKKYLLFTQLLYYS